MAMTEAHPLHALRAAAESVGYVSLAANNGALPGAGATHADVVRKAGITGWAVVTQHQADETPRPHTLQAAVAHLREQGF
jgi:peptidoglycan/xylan/chitin deacetylase (PgdA/CDA1 family)